MIDVETYAAAKAYTDAHGGGGGTTNYNALENKPQIAGTTLQGNKSLADLGIASASDVATALGNKVDKVTGKGLSTNDYSDTEKEKVADNTSAIEATQDMLSDAYDSTQTYNVGDYCIYNNILYKCNTAIATPEAFTPAKWDATTVASEITYLRDKKSEVIDFGEITGGIAAAWDLLTVYNKPVLCCWGEGGKSLALLYKYPNGFGMGFSQIYYSNSLVTLSVVNGEKTTVTINP